MEKEGKENGGEERKVERLKRLKEIKKRKDVEGKKSEGATL